MKFDDVVRTDALHVQIAAQYRDLIQNGILLPGERIPTFREEAQRFGVGMTTMARVFRILKEEGLVYSVVGSGTYVTRQGGTVESRLLDILAAPRSSSWEPTDLVRDLLSQHAHELAQKQRAWLVLQGYEEGCVCGKCTWCVAQEYIGLIDPRD